MTEINYSEKLKQLLISNNYDATITNETYTIALNDFIVIIIANDNGSFFASTTKEGEMFSEEDINELLNLINGISKRIFAKDEITILYHDFDKTMHILKSDEGRSIISAKEYDFWGKYTGEFSIYNNPSPLYNIVLTGILK